jgi:hypothetical protein
MERRFASDGKELREYRAHYLKAIVSWLIVATAASAAITPHITLNRSSGVAPLAVFADATATEGLAGGDYVNANFAWNFDRDGADSTGRHSSTRGFVAAHVYENPGTYAIALSVTDRSGATASATALIEVSAFSGTTYYVASGGSNSAAGTSMDAPLATPDYALKNKAGPNTRILLRNGDRFTVPAVNASGAGPVIVGSYADPNHASNLLPVLVNNENGWGFISFDKSAGDWRIMDLAVTAPDNRAFSLAGTDILLLRVSIDSVGKDFCYSGGPGHFVFDCSMRDFGFNGGAGYGLYGDTFSQSAFVGNVSRLQKGGEHLFRTQSGAKMFIAYNDIDSVVDVMSGIQIRGSSTQAYVIGNHVTKDCGIHPQNSTSAEHESYCVADGNTFINSSLGITAVHVAVRNNLFCNTVPEANYPNGAVDLSVHPLVGMSDDVTILNNSSYGTPATFVTGSATNTVLKNNIFYSLTTYNYAAGVDLRNAAGNYRIDNNIYYAPKKGSSLWFAINGTIYGQSGFGAWQAAGADVHGKNIDPKFVSTDPASANFLTLAPGSPAIGMGAVAGDGSPVFCDIDGAPRASGQATDAGARLYGTAVARRMAGGKVPATIPPRTGVSAFDILGRAIPLPAREKSPGSPGVIILRQANGVYSAALNAP